MAEYDKMAHAIETASIALTQIGTCPNCTSCRELANTAIEILKLLKETDTLVEGRESCRTFSRTSIG